MVFYFTSAGELLSGANVNVKSNVNVIMNQMAQY